MLIWILTNDRKLTIEAVLDRPRYHFNPNWGHLVLQTQTFMWHYLFTSTSQTVWELITAFRRWHCWNYPYRWTFHTISMTFNLMQRPGFELDSRLRVAPLWGTLNRLSYHSCSFVRHFVQLPVAVHIWHYVLASLLHPDLAPLRQKWSFLIG